jgi:drug/metabolite transporter (DMT)-like permease
MFGSHSKGVNFALAAALISGVSIFINKFAVTAIKQPLFFTTVKNAGVAILIIGILIVSGKWRQIQKLTRHELGLLFLIGVVGGSIPFYLFFTGLSTIPAINGAIIQKTLIIWVALLALPFLKEKLSRGSAVAVLLLFAANILVGGFSGFKFSTGEGLVLLATLFWAVEIVLAKKILPTVDPDILTAARMGFGSLLLLSTSLVLQPTALNSIFSLSANQWGWLVLTMVLLLAYVTTWYRALKFAPATVVTSVLVAATIVTNFLSAIFITHSINLLLIFQSALIITGIIVLIRMELKSALQRSQNLVGPVL